MTQWLLDTLLATSALMLLVLLIREPVRRHFGSRVAYGLWLLPAARLLMPTIRETVERPVMFDVSPRLLSVQASVEPMLMSRVTPVEPGLIDQLGGWPLILIAVWLGGAAALFANRMRAFHRERAAILASSNAIGRVGQIRIVRSAEVVGPMAFGIVDRVIAVPADFDRLYQPHERRLALEHELSHHRSGDLIANLFAFVLLCLQWFNPLAWVAHAAFRFDQEAACDARVLDKVNAGERADYGRAIAKAASGRALLFASALDRRNTLHKRLKSMLSNPTNGRRTSGRAMILVALAVSLPLTATRAIDYVDVPVAPAAPAQAATAPLAPRRAPAPAAPAAAIAAPAAAIAPNAPQPPVAPAAGNGRRVLMIDGQRKNWDDLTPEQKAEVRRSIEQAREELARTRVDRAEIRREMREAMAEMKSDHAGHRREMARAKAEIADAIREIDSEAAELRRAGLDPEQLKATIRASLAAVDTMEIDRNIRKAMSKVDERAIAASIAAAEKSMAAAKAELDRLEKSDNR
ncbi:M56 family metallopeptidase [Sphingomonas xanthus]|uniref:Peptidase M56 domain-containing protein n=1 Tax=Sphingomonas xanthus TaxID=2594473 RepID=A0A516IPX8_9SPHN|nr:M56 family metallopeptidase [Sphingomonas xanthus]QDP18951.1 hypothetical protein FMM02_02620 [Sphingomonas xanthus]